ncbi:MAG: VWA domain-containing protein [Acidobacteria bacterium]|nr:VWA domain-containing protein [Acidobacteriota bacterium]
MPRTPSTPRPSRRPASSGRRRFAPITLALWAVAFLLAGSASSAAPAGDQPEASFGTQVEVSEVALDVLVTDKDGNVIIGLGPEDFKVEEGGKAIDLDSVSFYSNRILDPDAALPASTGVTAKDSPQSRYFIFFFHDQRKLAGEAFQIYQQQVQAGRSSQQWVREEMLPGDWVAVVGYDVKLKVYQDFTQDRAALVSAIDQAVRAEEGGNWPSRAATGGPSLAEFLPTGPDLGRKTRNIYKGLQVLADAAGHIQGRKNLLLFSLGFGDISRQGYYFPDVRYYPDTLEKLNDSNVAVYSIDLSPPEVRHSLEGALNQIARESGGEYYFNHTSFISPLRRISEATNGYYLLSYESTHPAGEKGYQKVSVRAVNPEWKVRARSGYRYGE